AIFYGFKPVVVAIVVIAVIRIGRKALKNTVMYAIAIFAFVALYFFKVPFPAIIVGAGVIGFIGGKLWPAKFDVISAHDEPQIRDYVEDEHAYAHTRPSLRRDLRTAI